MRSLTSVDPSLLMEITSWKSAIRQLCAERGTVSPNKQNKKSEKSLNRRVIEVSRFAAEILSEPLELHGYRFTVGRRHFKELTLLEAKHPGKNIRREGLDFRIQIAHHRIVVTACVLNAVFGQVQ